MFEMRGEFDLAVEKGIQALYWGDEDITDRIMTVRPNSITGMVPPSDTPGRRQVVLVIDLITYWNPTAHFTYAPLPQGISCWPYSGQTSFETMLTITGEYLDDEITCLFGEPGVVEFSVLAILKSGTEIICPMS